MGPISVVAHCGKVCLLAILACSLECCNYGILPHYHIKGRLSIQEECKDWLLGFEEALLDNFSEEKGSKVMAGTFTLELGWGLCQPPFLIVFPANVQVQALGKEGAGAD